MVTVGQGIPLEDLFGLLWICNLMVNRGIQKYFVYYRKSIPFLLVLYSL